MKKASNGKLIFSKTTIFTFRAQTRQYGKAAYWNTTTNTATISSNGTTVQPTISTGVFTID